MKKLIVAAAAVVLVGAGAALTVSMLSAQAPGASHRTVRTIGSETFVPNSRVASNLRFLPGDITIRSGGTITLRDQDDTGEPHTLSIVSAADVPSTIDDVFGCGAPDTICDAIFQSLGPADPPAHVNEAPGSMPGLDARLDTLWVNPGESVNVIVSAPTGTTLYYICAIHAWMQGRIIVQ
jgi:hypothetical protein